MTLHHDPDADALYIKLGDLPYAFGEDLDHERRVDYSADGQPVGIEILGVSAGIDTRGLPDEAAVTALLEKMQFKVFV